VATSLAALALTAGVVAAPASGVTAPRDLVTLDSPFGVATLPALVGGTHALSFSGKVVQFPGSTPSSSSVRTVALQRRVTGGAWRSVPFSSDPTTVGGTFLFAPNIPRAAVAYYRVVTAYGSTDVVPVTSRAAGVAAVVVTWPVYAPPSVLEPAPRSSWIGYAIVTDTAAYGRSFVVYLQHHNATGWHTNFTTTISVAPKKTVVHRLPVIRVTGTWRLYAPALGLSAPKTYGRAT
jgi:hypothetical protein